MKKRCFSCRRIFDKKSIVSRSRILKVTVSEGVVSVSNGQVSVSDDSVSVSVSVSISVSVSVSVSDDEAETPSLKLVQLDKF